MPIALRERRFNKAKDRSVIKLKSYKGRRMARRLKTYMIQ